MDNKNILYNILNIAAEWGAQCEDCQSFPS